MTVLTSPSWPAGIGDNRSEAEVRAIRARRCAVESQMRAEGTPEREIARLATDDLAEKMLAHERRVTGLIVELFTGIGSGIK